MKCDSCGRGLTHEEIEKGWPVSYFQFGHLCPDCFGQGSKLRCCGELMSLEFIDNYNHVCKK